MRISTIVIGAGSLLALLVCCAPVEAAQPAKAPAEVNLWQYVHPDTNMLMGLDWQRAKTSGTGRMFARQFATKAGGFSASGPAMALLDNVDRILISTNGQTAVEPNQPPVVIALDGRIDRAQLKKMMPVGTALERFKGADLLVPPRSKEPEMLAAVVSDRIVLIGDRDSLGRVLESGAGTRNVDLLERATALSAKCEFWLVSAVPPSMAAGGAMPGMKQLDDVESMDLGVALQHGLGIQANLVTKSEDSAKSMATMVQLLAAMAGQRAKDAPELASVARNLTVKTEGLKVQIQMDVPLAQLERGMVQMRAAAATGGKRTLESFLGMQPSGNLPEGFRPAANGLPQSAAMAPVTVAQPPTPPQKRTIRISGLDDGPKEITYTSGGTPN